MATDAQAYRRADVPIRIYALAKDLKIDSKELVEFCNKAGIPGKGSALASLEDDEVAKLKTWMEASSTKRQPSAPAALVDTRAVLSSPVATATLPPPPPPRTAPTRTRLGAPSIPLTPSTHPLPPAAKAKETAPPSISAKAATTETPIPETAAPVAHAAAPISPPHAPPASRSAPPVSTMAPPSGEVAPVRGETMFGKRGGIKVLDAKTKR